MDMIIHLTKKRRPIGRRFFLSDGAESLSAPYFILKTCIQNSTHF